MVLLGVDGDLTVQPVGPIPWLMPPCPLTASARFDNSSGGLVLAAVLALSPYEASKECKGGAFNAGFGPAFDAQRCDIVLKFGGAGREIRIPLRDILQLCCPPKQACTSRRTLMGVGC